MATKFFLVSLLASGLPSILAAPAAAGDFKSSLRTPNRAGAGNMFKARQESCSGASTDAPVYYSGPYTSFPSLDQWVDFSTMFSANEQTMVDAGSTWDDVGRINVAITDASSSIGIDPRVILGIIMQESHGYVGVETTYDADGNPTGGLMQASGCTGYDGQNGLPQADTSAMVTCGSTHYKQNLEDWGNLLDTSSILPALREYNSGSVDENDLSDAPNISAMELQFVNE